jgi:lysophospholipase L1-like esterase
VEPGRSPGGKEENTENTSAFSDRLMMGVVEVISTNPVKLCRLSRGPRLAAPCANGPSCMFVLHMPNSGGPAFRVPGVFTNYAVGRAGARQCNTVPAACPGGEYPLGVVDLSFEVSRFVSDFAGSAPSGNLYVIWIGANDIDDALTALAAGDVATAVAIVQAAVGAEAASLEALYGAGARTFLVPTAVNFALTPLVRSLGPAAQFAATQVATAYNGGLDTVIATLSALLPGIQFIRFDGNAVFAAIEANPGAFGITDALDSCLTFGVIGNVICATPNRYLFWDGIHPTTTGRSLVAAGVLQTLPH